MGGSSSKAKEAAPPPPPSEGKFGVRVRPAVPSTHLAAATAKPFLARRGRFRRR